MDDEYDVRGLHEDALDKAAEACDDSVARRSTGRARRGAVRLVRRALSRAA